MQFLFSHKLEAGEVKDPLTPPEVGEVRIDFETGTHKPPVHKPQFSSPDERADKVVIPISRSLTTEFC